MQVLKLLSHHEKLVRQSAESERAVSAIEADLAKVRRYMAPLEARVKDTRDLLEKLELELGERKTDMESMEARKTQQLEAIDVANVEIQDIIL